MCTLKNLTTSPVVEEDGMSVVAECKDDILIRGGGRILSYEDLPTLDEEEDDEKMSVLSGEPPPDNNIIYTTTELTDIKPKLTHVEGNFLYHSVIIY